MKFKIISSDFFSREEDRGTLSLIVGDTNEILYLNATARLILNPGGVWRDFDEFIDGLAFADVPRERLVEDFEALLFKLDAHGVALLREIDCGRETGARVARPRDIQALSSFLINHVAAPRTCAVSEETRFYHRQGLYGRMMGQKEFIVIDEVIGQIGAALLFTWPKRAEGNTVMSLDSAFFDDQMSDAACEQALMRMISAFTAALHGACGKLRYVYMNPRQDFIKAALLKAGFQKTAELKKETLGGRDAEYLDKCLF